MTLSLDISKLRPVRHDRVLSVSFSETVRMPSWFLTKHGGAAHKPHTHEGPVKGLGCAFDGQRRRPHLQYRHLNRE